MTSDIQLNHFSVGSMDNNVYILVDPDSGESILFDAPTDAAKILSALEGAKLRYILMTHADGDHIQALQEIREKTGAPVAIHPAEAGLLPSPPDLLLHDEQTIPLGSHEIKVFHTPGHTPGGMSFLVDDILIDGDTLFPGGPGATKRDFGSFDQIIESIRDKLFTLPDDTRVFPGHGSSTTIGAERPHLQEWIDRGW